MAEKAPTKWEGKATSTIKGSTAEQVWPLWADFCGVDKWYPELETCYQVEGELGQPGLVRYVAKTISKPSSNGGEEEEKQLLWTKEKLLSIDPDLKCLSYKVSDGNMGFNSYVATINLFPIEDDYEELGCKVEWSFVVDPIQGWKLEDLVDFIQYCLDYMTEKMSASLQSTP